MAHNKALWLARLLFRYGPLSKNEIMDRWAAEDEYGRRMASSTFYDNRNLLAERYGLHTTCRDGRYSLDEANDGNRHFYARYLLGEGDRYGEHEPLGSEHLPAVDNAVRRRRELAVRYNPFDKKGYETLFHPYLLRVFKGRCYAVGHSGRHGGVRIFALDRVAYLHPTGNTFVPDPAFRAEEFFRYSFGIYGGTHLTPEHVVIEVEPALAPYVVSLPLHPSQRTEKRPDGGVRLEMDVALTRDLVAELLSYGGALRIVAPEALRRRVLDEALAIVRRLQEP